MYKAICYGEPAEMLQASQDDHLPNAKTPILAANTWKVRSMEDLKGPTIEVVSQQRNDRRDDDIKIDQIMQELRKYNASMGALQERKWFGDGSTRWIVVYC